MITVVFAVAVGAVAIYGCNTVATIYSLPLLAGGGLGWLVSFLLLRKRLKDLNAYMLCK